jgi:dipeptidyl aminopeptidase/acylaminoacyl peptidase
MQRYWLAGAIALTVWGSASAQTAPLTLERIMAEPDWIGAPAQNAYWGTDGGAVYYHVKRTNSPIHDLHRIDVASGKDSVVDPNAMASTDGPPTFDSSGKQAAFVRNGDLFVRDLGNGSLRQVTRSTATETSPQFSADGRKLSFRNGTEWFVYDIANAVAAPAAIVKLEKDPDANKPDDLRDMQLRIFSTLKRNHDDKRTVRENAEAMQKADPTRAPLPFYLGDDVQLVDTALSSDAHWLLAVTSPKSFDEGKKGKLTRYVTESGYEEFEDERTRVGRGDSAPHALWLLDLAAHTSTKLAFDTLPGIHDDPLKSVREENAKEIAKSADVKAEKKDDAKDKSGKGEKSKPDEKARGIQVAGMAFSRDGSNAAVQLHSNDNKDRWIATIDFAKHALVTQHRLTDPAWINWNFNEFGWEKDNRTLWYVSEETGFAQLYAKTIDGKSQALTSGRFEISHPELSNDGRWFYVRANAQAPWAYDVYRVPTGGGKFERVTKYEGLEQFSLSQDDKHLLVTHSSSYVPSQISVVDIDGGAAHELTDTRTADYKAMQWVAPEIVQVPSTHFKGSISAKFYKPQNFDKSTKHPAVLFVHGAGYTQNVHEQFPYYFREQMFHNMLLQHGYVVLDMDYRASEGYGRDWRDAIYRQMGHPELEDLLDGKHWLTENYNVDPKRIGMYGGSYGGFMTLMALFRTPGEFAAGAALRPVTDWTQYNHEYTGNILNDPQLDPIAYKRSSPIEFSEGLKDSLLICHGVIDDNVLFEDSMRLYQRLIELHKDNFTISPYPLDRHGFVNADSWLDEYKRIYRLFEGTIGRAN